MIKKKLGFTLIEVMVTIVILGILIVPLTRLIIFSVWGTKQTKDFVVAFNLAKDKMERMKILDFDEIISEPNDIFSEDQLNLNPDSESFLKDYKKRYLMKYKPFPKKIAIFERIVKVDEKADKIHAHSQLKKVSVIIRKKGSSKVLTELVTLVCKY